MRDEVLFVLPPGGLAPGFREHLGAAFVRAVLADAGVSSSQYREPRDVGLAAFARHLERHAPAVVGLTAYDTNLRACRALVDVVRRTLPEALVVVGGPNATFTPDETLAYVGADVCVRGAGEAATVDLARAVLGVTRPRAGLAGRLAGVPNLAVRTDEGVAHTPVGDLSSFPGGRFRSLDDLPSPYQRGLVEDAATGVLTARGCNQHCTYCSFATISGRRVHFHSVERVLDDLTVLAAVAARSASPQAVIDVFDDAFTLAPERARRICEGMIARGLRLPLTCATRVDNADPELLELMKRAGFVAVFFGIESAVPRVLRAIGKVQAPNTADDPRLDRERLFLDQAQRAVAAAKAVGLRVGVSVIGGLPGETATDFRATLAFVESLGADSYAHNILSVLPGTPLYAARAAHGLEAWRDHRTGNWRTRHTYDVDAVQPVAGADVLAYGDQEARLITDALCGRARAGRSAAGAAWAVVLHERDPEGLGWLSELLAVDGVVVVTSRQRRLGARDHGAWLRALEAARVPYGTLALVSRVGRGGWTGGASGHEFSFGRSWRRARKALERDPAGRLRVPVWLASAAERPPPRSDVDLLASPAPQIADACRWSDRPPRCLEPEVLHVWPDGRVTACWGGPTLGGVGDTHAAVAARGRTLAVGRRRASHGCPLGARTGGGEHVSRLEVASMVAWALV